MRLYELAWPLIRKLPPEWAHRLGLAALRFPMRWAPVVDDPFIRCGLTFRNRMGIAAGFDKNAVALAGLERLGVGFVEVGTILVAPWPGNPDRPRLKRLLSERAIWNRLGFPSEGLDTIEPRLARFPRGRRRGMLVGCNIGPHPGHLKAAGTPEAFIDIAREELRTLVDRLRSHADFFVVNLSSPNTAGLRGILCDPRLARDLLAPLKRCRDELPLFLKLPPEDVDRLPWTTETLGMILEPILAERACDGFVAVNTSTRLTKDLIGLDAGGVSGAPLLPLAGDTIRLLRSLVGPESLILGGGGVMKPADAIDLLDAGADIIEIYSGMIYSGPALPAACARALAERVRTSPGNVLSSKQPAAALPGL